MADRSAADDAATRAATRALVGSFSVEVTPPELAKLPDLPDHLGGGTRVYLTYLPKVDFADVVAAAARLRDTGLRPVVHLAARAVPDLAALDRMLGTLVDVGVEDLLLIAGSAAEPVGALEDTIQVLESPAFLNREWSSVGVAGHPEGNPGVDDGRVEAALSTKNKIAAEHGLPLHVVTQFCFASEPVVAWERRMRDQGNALPIHVGLPGLTSPARLLKFGLACGVGPSLAVLRKQTGGVLKLATTPVYHPDETLHALAAARAADPDALLAGIHFFPFGAVRATAAWARAVRDGHFAVDRRRGRLTVDV
ncbi:methylenetetrahydrofolate reductase [Pseudonocardia dioxanivorans]|uniref:methylenetetrahydrofolate reductase n=1 Tax=Pseudonocardia dioxanivorans TaxID=240495 RepID=UPI000CD0B4A4|nr:methylenetetrahydrofolate reductase [Pseudonocardia dioxanivorans]